MKWSSTDLRTSSGNWSCLVTVSTVFAASTIRLPAFCSSEAMTFSM
jgi:hypothetical protein